MPDITISIKPVKMDRILDAFGYTPEKGGKQEFIKKELIDIIKSKVAMAELEKIQQATPTVDVENLDIV